MTSYRMPATWSFYLTSSEENGGYEMGGGRRGHGAGNLATGRVSGGSGHSAGNHTSEQLFSVEVPCYS